jgi:hypothetical protein
MRTKYIPVINHKLKYIIGNCKERQKKSEPWYNIAILDTGIEK